MINTYIMPPQPSSFEHSALEADIARLAEEIQKHKEAPETKNLSEQEILRHAIKEFPAPQAPVPSAGNDDSGQSGGFLPSYAEDAPAETKLELEYLIDIAFHGGIARAVGEARNAPAFVQDALHDALAGKLYPILREKGILK